MKFIATITIETAGDIETIAHDLRAILNASLESIPTKTKYTYLNGSSISVAKVLDGAYLVQPIEKETA